MTILHIVPLLSPPRTQIRAAGRCLGIRCTGNVWARAKRRRGITHHLLAGGVNNIGWEALRWQELVGTDEVRFGKLRELIYLPKKIANSLHEFRAGNLPCTLRSCSAVSRSYKCVIIRNNVSFSKVQCRCKTAQPAMLGEGVRGNHPHILHIADQSHHP